MIASDHITAGSRSLLPSRGRPHMTPNFAIYRTIARWPQLSALLVLAGLACTRDAVAQLPKSEILRPGLGDSEAADSFANMPSMAEAIEASEQQVAQTRRLIYLWSREELAGLCPRGHRVDFVFGRVSLFVDPRAMGFSGQSDIALLTGGTCPTSHVNDISLFFYYPDDPDAQRMFSDWHLPPHISIGDANRRLTGPAPSTIPVNERTRLTARGGGTVEDITGLMYGASDIRQRIYRLQHPVSADDAEPEPFVFACNGPQITRKCQTSYRYQSDLAISYEFNLSPFHWPHGMPSALAGPIAEPEELLAIDARVRAWVRFLMQSPQR